MMAQVLVIFNPRLDMIIGLEDCPDIMGVLLQQGIMIQIASKVTKKQKFFKVIRGQKWTIIPPGIFKLQTFSRIIKNIYTFSKIKLLYFSYSQISFPACITPESRIICFGGWTGNTGSGTGGSTDEVAEYATAQRCEIILY